MLCDDETVTFSDLQDNGLPWNNSKNRVGNLLLNSSWVCICQLITFHRQGFNGGPYNYLQQSWVWQFSLLINWCFSLQFTGFMFSILTWMSLSSFLRWSAMNWTPSMARPIIGWYCFSSAFTIAKMENNVFMWSQDLLRDLKNGSRPFLENGQTTKALQAHYLSTWSNKNLKWWSFRHTKS